MNQRKRKILIVDDEKSFTDLMEMNFVEEGSFDVCVENKSTRAIEVAREFRPDVILLDIVMPEQDGGDILRQLKADEQLKSIPTILVSALVSNKEVESDLAVHTDDGLLLAKPSKFEVMLRHVNAATAAVA